MKRWIALLLAVILCGSLAACTQEKECENCAKLEQEIEKLENKIDKLEEKLEKYEPGGGGIFDSTAPEINHTSTFISRNPAVLTIALQGEEQFDRFLSVQRSAELCPYPADLNRASADGLWLNVDSLLRIPVYGADGRVHELVANTVTGTYDQDKNGYVPSGDKGFRAVGPAENNVITDEYAYIFDLSFRTKNGSESIFYDSGYFLLSADQPESEELLQVYGDGLVLVFYDTASGAILGRAFPDVSEAIITADEKHYQVPLEYKPFGLINGDNYLAGAAQESDRNISVLLYLDGSTLTNAGVLMGHMGISGIHLQFEAA